jgi:hypothetical protein
MPSKAVGLSPKGILAVFAKVNVSEGRLCYLFTISSSLAIVVMNRTSALFFMLCIVSCYFLRV